MARALLLCLLCFWVKLSQCLGWQNLLQTNADIHIRQLSISDAQNKPATLQVRDDWKHWSNAPAPGAGCATVTSTITAEKACAPATTTVISTVTAGKACSPAISTITVGNGGAPAISTVTVGNGGAPAVSTVTVGNGGAPAILTVTVGNGGTPATLTVTVGNGGAPAVSTVTVGNGGAPAILTVTVGNGGASGISTATVSNTATGSQPGGEGSPGTTGTVSGSSQGQNTTLLLISTSTIASTTITTTTTETIASTTITVPGPGENASTTVTSTSYTTVSATLIIIGGTWGEVINGVTNAPGCSATSSAVIGQAQRQTYQDICVGVYRTTTPWWAILLLVLLLLFGLLILAALVLLMFAKKPWKGGWFAAKAPMAGICGNCGSVCVCEKVDDTDSSKGGVITGEHQCDPDKPCIWCGQILPILRPFGNSMDVQNRRDIGIVNESSGGYAGAARQSRDDERMSRNEQTSTGMVQMNRGEQTQSTARQSSQQERTNQSGSNSAGKARADGGTSVNEENSNENSNSYDDHDYEHEGIFDIGLKSVPDILAFGTHGSKKDKMFKNKAARSSRQTFESTRTGDTDGNYGGGMISYLARQKQDDDDDNDDRSDNSEQAHTPDDGSHRGQRSSARSQSNTGNLPGRKSVQMLESKRLVSSRSRQARDDSGSKRSSYSDMRSPAVLVGRTRSSTESGENSRGAQDYFGGAASRRSGPMDESESDYAEERGPRNGKRRRSAGSKSGGDPFLDVLMSQPDDEMQSDNEGTGNRQETTTSQSQGGSQREEPHTTTNTETHSNIQRSSSRQQSQWSSATSQTGSSRQPSRQDFYSSYLSNRPSAPSMTTMASTDQLRRDSYPPRGQTPALKEETDETSSPSRPDSRFESFGKQEHKSITDLYNLGQRPDQGSGQR